MAKPILRKKAIELRLQGYTYSQIKQELGLQKSTLSDWLRNLPLSISQTQALEENKTLAENLRRERFRQTMANKQLERYKTVFERESKSILPL